MTVRIIHTTGDFLLELFPTLFLAILFLQSGLDKVVDRRGNLAWMGEHFAKSPLASFVPLMLTAITLLELLAGALSGLGVLQLLFSREHVLAFWGAAASALALTALFFGQRMAKAYEGAAVLVPYFLVALAALYILR